MKLWNVLSVAALGTLFAVGCSASSTGTTDAGPEGGTGTDTGGAKDTGGTTDGAKTDTGGGTVDAPMDCATCQKEACKDQQAACAADETKLKGCNDLITCMNACSDEACANKCITESSSTEGKALIQCIIDKCTEACSG